MDLVPTEVLDLAIAGDVVTAVTGALIGAEVELFQNDVNPTRGSVIADFDVATFAGYNAEAVQWLEPSRADDGNIEVVGTLQEFRPTDDVTPNTIFGFFVTDGGTEVLYAARFENAPLPMGSTLDSILLTLRARIPAGGMGSTVS